MMKIGEFLIEVGAITDEQLKYALRKQRKEPDKKVGEILVDLNYLSLSEFTRLLQQHLSSPKF